MDDKTDDFTLHESGHASNAKFISPTQIEAQYEHASLLLYEDISKVRNDMMKEQFKTHYPQFKKKNINVSQGEELVKETGGRLIILL